MEELIKDLQSGKRIVFLEGQVFQQQVVFPTLEEKMDYIQKILT